MNVKEMIGVTGGVIFLMGVGYTAALRGKWITDGVMVEAIAQEAAQKMLAPTELENLEWRLEDKRNQLRPLQRIPKEERSEEDQDAIDDLKADIKTLKKRIARAKGQDLQEEELIDE